MVILEVSVVVRFLVLMSGDVSENSGPEVIKKIFMLNSAENEILNAH